MKDFRSILRNMMMIFCHPFSKTHILSTKRMLKAIEKHCRKNEYRISIFLREGSWQFIIDMMPEPAYGESFDECVRNAYATILEGVDVEEESNEFYWKTHPREYRRLMDSF